MFIPPAKIISAKLRILEIVTGLLFVVPPFLYALLKGCYNSVKIYEDEGIVGLSESYLNSSWHMDLTDGQYENIHSNLPLLCLVSFCFITFRKILTLWSSDSKPRIIYYLCFGIGGMSYLHGLGVVVVLAIIILNYVLCHFLAHKKWFPWVAWGFNFTLLMWSKTDYSKIYLYEFVTYWNAFFGLIMLKMMSFMMDYHWFKLERASEGFHEHLAKCNECTKGHPCIKFRMQEHSDDYSLLSFLSYVCYYPLYVAGPTTTYNTWRSQVNIPRNVVSLSYILQYLVRLIVVFVLLETLLHFSYYNAILDKEQNEHIWKDFGIYELIFASYCMLNFIWLKFTFIWRFFRLIALIDGIESPENMGRCMTNNYCFIDFWKNWHKSFNLWLVRYLYIPLGGGRCKIFNIWVVFGFVALWHDLSLDLLAWGWGMCLIIMPEVMLQGFFSKKRYDSFRGTLYYSWLCAFAGGFDCVCMAAANLVGFAFGIYGLEIILEEIDVYLCIKLYVMFVFHTNTMRMLLNFKSRENTKELQFKE